MKNNRRHYGLPAFRQRRGQTMAIETAYDETQAVVVAKAHKTIRNRQRAEEREAAKLATAKGKITLARFSWDKTEEK